MQRWVCYFLVLVAPILGLGIWQYMRDDKKHLLSVHYSAALEGAKLLKEWCTWLATISTATIGASVFIVQKPDLCLCSSPTLASLGIASFTCAIIFTATLLLALPSLVSRLKYNVPRTTNDLYESVAFLWVWPIFRPAFRVGFLAFAQYYFFLSGVIFVAIHAFRVAQGPC